MKGFKTLEYQRWWPLTSVIVREELYGRSNVLSLTSWSKPCWTKWLCWRSPYDCINWVQSLAKKNKSFCIETSTKLILPKKSEAGIVSAPFLTLMRLLLQHPGVQKQMAWLSSTQRLDLCKLQQEKRVLFECIHLWSFGV